MALRMLESSDSKSVEMCSSRQHPPLLSSHSPPSHLRVAPVVSSTSFCCPRRRKPMPRPNFSAATDAAADDLSRARETPAYLWRKDEKWHPVSYDGFSAATAVAISVPSLPPPSGFMTDRPSHRHRTPKKKPHHPKPSRMFSSDEEEGADEEDEADVTTADSSFEMTELRSRRAAMMEGTKTENNSPWSRLSPYLGVGEGESLAVEKQSEDPRADFRRSMAEMVVQKGIYEAGDLEKLLHCFLSLNSQHHHRAIIAAFADVWEALFPATPFNRSPGPANKLGAY